MAHMLAVSGGGGGGELTSFGMPTELNPGCIMRALMVGVFCVF